MTDQNQTPASRVFKIGTTRIVEDPSMSPLDQQRCTRFAQNQLPGNRQRHHP